VYTFGFNVKGQLGHGDQTSLNVPKMVEALNRKFVTTVGCSYYHSIFSCSDELETYACGRNDYGQLGLGHQEDRSIPILIESLNGKKVVSVGCG
jgi:RCC1 and BTB domain-containing protein